MTDCRARPDDKHQTWSHLICQCQVLENRHADRVKVLMFSLNSFFYSFRWRAGLVRAQKAAQSLHPEARTVLWDARLGRKGHMTSASVASQRRLAAAAEREKELTHGSVTQKAVSVDDKEDLSEGAQLSMSGSPLSLSRTLQQGPGGGGAAGGGGETSLGILK